MLEFLGNTEYSNSFDNNSDNSDNDDEGVVENGEYTPENKRHLSRLEEEFLQELATGYFIKDFLQTVMFNSFNTFITMYCIQIGIGLTLSGIAGFSIGAIPALKNIGDNFRLSIGETKTVATNGRFMKGVFSTYLSGHANFQRCV